jgi:cytochrome c peroxidase
VQSSSEGSSQSSPEFPVIVLIENPSSSLPNVDTAGISNEPNPQAPKHTLAAAQGASNADGAGSSGAQGSRGPAVRLVPFQCMPQSTQEELGKELFDDPLLSVDNVKKLADYMQWSFKYTKVSLLLLIVFFE